MKRKTTEEFIEQAREIHGDKYDYSPTKYINNYSVVEIVCKKCGKQFSQTPYVHLRGSNCPYCSRMAGNEKKKLTIDYFLKKAKEVHGDEYDYSKVDLNNRINGKVIIICRKHGEFLQNPSAHISGQKCKKCSMEKLNNSKKITNDEFLERARKIHGDKYTYLDEYMGWKKKIRIKCNVCGFIFKQAPSSHCVGVGCPQCDFSGLENEILAILKRYNIEYIPQYKNKEIYGSKIIDFYLPNDKVIIECQGGQHFRPVSIFGGDKAYRGIIKRDKEKYIESIKNGISVIYYSHDRNTPKKYFDTIYKTEEEIVNIFKEYGIIK